MLKTSIVFEFYFILLWSRRIILNKMVLRWKLKNAATAKFMKTTPHPARNNLDVPFNQAYWITPGLMMAGCYPGSEDRAQAQRQLQGLIDHGIRHVVNLMETGERNRIGHPFVPYADQMQSIAAARQCPISFDRMPIKDGSVPSRIEIGRILDNIDASIAAGRPVYVHCLGGLGRTGTVVGCYLARHGIAAGRNVIKMIRDLRRNTLTQHLNSPETNQQMDLVESWVEAE
jgi:hypothetical protein